MAFDPNKKPKLKHLMDLAERVNTELAPVKAQVQALESAVPKKVSDLDNDAKYQTASDVAATVAATAHLKRQKVASVDAIDLTAADADQYIYMVPKTGGKNGDKYDEYLVMDGALEPVGDWKVDLSDYQQKEEGKGLSTNDFTNEDKEKLGKALTEDDLASDAEVAEMLDQVFGTSADAGAEE